MLLLFYSILFQIYFHFTLWHRWWIKICFCSLNLQFDNSCIRIALWITWIPIYDKLRLKALEVHCVKYPRFTWIVVTFRRTIQWVWAIFFLMPYQVTADCFGIGWRFTFSEFFLFLLLLIFFVFALKDPTSNFNLNKWFWDPIALPLLRTYSFWICQGINRKKNIGIVFRRCACICAIFFLSFSLVVAVGPNFWLFVLS